MWQATGIPSRRMKGYIMALIKCPECMNQVSSTAISCPQCGAPIAGSVGAGTPMQTTNEIKEAKTTGIICLVIGGAVGIWTFIRATSFSGQFHSWTPPFTQYETITLIGGGFALILIIIGLLNLSMKDN